MDPPQSEQITKKIDKEHVVIEKIFKITIDPEKSNNFHYLEQYHAILMSIGEDEKVAFRIKNLESILIEYIFRLQEVQKDTMDYLLVSYHRAIVMIEKK